MEIGRMDNSEYTSNHLRALAWSVTARLAALALRIRGQLTFRSNSLLAAGWDYTIPGSTANQWKCKVLI